MKEGSVITTSFVQANGQIKVRPAIILKKIPPFDDYLVCAVSSQTRHYISGLDLLVDHNHKDFRKSGFIMPSVIRTAMITTLPTGVIQGKIGELSNGTYLIIIDQLTNFLKT